MGVQQEVKSLWHDCRRNAHDTRVVGFTKRIPFIARVLKVIPPVFFQVRFNYGNIIRNIDFKQLIIFRCQIRIKSNK